MKYLIISNLNVVENSSQIILLKGPTDLKWSK